MDQSPQSLPPTKIIDFFEIQLNQLLGEGNFAKVYKAYGVKDRNVEAAVKMIPMAKLQQNRDHFDLFEREIEILRQIKCENVACLLDAKLTPNNLYIFMEYCDGSSLSDKLKKKGSFPEEEACSILKQIANAFVTIEKSPIYNKAGTRVTIMHRDIKPDNILFHKDKVKVADFGFAKIIPFDETMLKIKRTHTICGTPLYEAPQIIEGQSYSSKCDIWSAGVLFYEILFGTLPWQASSVYQLVEAVKVRPLYFPKSVSRETMDLIDKMLMVHEEDRISWSDVYNHPALNKTKKVAEANFIPSLMPSLQGFAQFQNNILQPTKVEAPNQQQANAYYGQDYKPSINLYPTSYGELNKDISPIQYQVPAYVNNEQSYPKRTFENVDQKDNSAGSSPHGFYTQSPTKNDEHRRFF